MLREKASRGENHEPGCSCLLSGWPSTPGAGVNAAGRLQTPAPDLAIISRASDGAAATRSSSKPKTGRERAGRQKEAAGCVRADKRGRADGVDDSRADKQGYRTGERETAEAASKPSHRVADVVIWRVKLRKRDTIT